MTNYRDLAIEHLALREGELIEHIASLQADILVYREMAQRSVAALAELTAERDQQKARIRSLVDEVRRYTAAAVGPVRTAA